jgi:hypothetical protein
MEVFEMKFRTTLIGIAALFLLILGACAPESPSAAPENTAQFEAEYQALLVELEAGGAQVEHVGVVDETTLGVEARQLNVNGFPVQVIIFEDEAQRLSLQEQLAQQPNLIPQTGGIEEGAQVMVWGEQRMMVIYAGNNLGVVEPLTDAMGEPALILESGAVG